MLNNRIAGKTVLITGASSGIGYASALAFASLNANLILMARREDALSRLKAEILSKNNVTVLTVILDVTKRKAVEEFFNDLPDRFFTIDILINNAGLALGLDTVHDGNIDHWDTMIGTNINGLMYMTQAVLKLMYQRQSGHVINIGSIAGEFFYAKGAAYCATKAAVHAFSRALREECIEKNIKISEILPGMVNTEFSKVRFEGDHDRADSVYLGFEPLVADDIADLIVYMANLPQHVNLAEAMILPTAQANARKTHRRS